VPGLETHIAEEFKIIRQARYGDDAFTEYVRV
jgi:diaminohydroxyphosphoribosylaminopyrimidine deaminase/5-amino-6-(5-phosphoribosylamino)uracil reductase